MRQVIDFFRARLSRVIFMWFAFTIVASVAVMWAAGGIVLQMREGTSRWEEEMSRVSAYASRVLAPAWDDPERRAELVDAATEDFDMHARLVDTEGMVLHQTPGWKACTGFDYGFPIRRGEERLGTFEVCNPRGAPVGRALFLLGSLAVILVLASWIVARRLGRPLRDLAATARSFGSGDLTSRVEVEGTGEIEDVSTAFNEMADQIVDQLEGQRRMLAEVSHELRTPLGHLRLLVEIIRDSGPSETRLNKLEREIGAMDDLVDQLLAGARLDFDLERSESLSPVDLAIAAAERVGKPEALDVAQGACEARVRGDASLLTRALSNLVQNAETHGGGLTRLEVVATEESLRFSIEDAGPGFDDTEEAFASFQKGDNGDGAGLGLGLSLVRRIARAHSGSVAVEPSPAGARVVLTLPRA